MLGIIGKRVFTSNLSKTWMNSTQWSFNDLGGQEGVGL